ncbi:helix-turn-helix transcriptional regulator [Chimaeribacter arupi]|uniref:ArsR/SmtB family transcription factor n=1 Tax=Chimaeribacter arupi TaxID=2060066 RepID=UPI000C7BFABE|nr:helix-turn-helix transcriptional regulator [Chimaeribacter arupi]PLR34517.1 transcriptional regulator [Chimaeribacter arupi]WKZ93912.1 helix-turn-helix transcriptional regulator [Chimaeribacter arupi]
MPYETIPYETAADPASPQADALPLEHHLAALAAAVADSSRAAMLCLLMDGRAYTATELGTVAGIAASTASAHLARLTEQHLVTMVKQGRYRYFRLAGAPVARMLEGLMGLAGGGATVRSSTPPALRFARTCYHHMAGTLGVHLHDRFLALGWLTGDGHYQLSEAGQAGLQRMGLALTPPPLPTACYCLDWSERRGHLAGALGAQLLQLFEQRRWVQRHLDSRALTLTAAGRQAVARHLGALPASAPR